MSISEDRSRVSLEALIPNEEERRKYSIEKSADEVREALAKLGYGPTKMFVDSLYIHENWKKAVGVLRVTKEHVDGHFGVFRGVDQIEHVGQALLLLQYYTNAIPQGKRPTLHHTDLWTYNVAFPGAVLNAFVELETPVNDLFAGKGLVVSGSRVISTVEGVGRMIKTDLLEAMIVRGARQEATNPSAFQPIGEL